MGEVSYEHYYSVLKFLDDAASQLGNYSRATVPLEGGWLTVF